MLSLERMMNCLYCRTLSNVLNILTLGLYVCALLCPALYEWNLVVDSVS